MLRLLLLRAFGIWLVIVIFVFLGLRFAIAIPRPDYVRGRLPQFLFALFVVSLPYLAALLIAIALAGIWCRLRPPK